jgi:2-dehydro-3-deoxyphosphogluconate aldolase / (4S)-4-hydroxy-2-oxoglutarate aldolase
MIKKQDVLSQIRETGFVAIVRALNEDQAFRITEACLAGGIKAVEITFTVPNADKVIKKLAMQYKSGSLLLGAGTVLNPETAALALDSGAEYIISPCLNVKTVEFCVKRGVACMPGAMTVKEAVECMEAGADIVKIFPAELFGPAIIKAFKAPLPNLPLMPTGGVSLENVGEWIKAGSLAVGVGGNLTAGAKTGNYAAITEIAAKYLARIREARL